MLDVIFRCRERMAVIYGRVAPGPLAGERFAQAQPGPALPLSKSPRPGEVARSGRNVAIRPMPPRVRP